MHCFHKSALQNKFPRRNCDSLRRLLSSVYLTSAIYFRPLHGATQRHQNRKRAPVGFIYACAAFVLPFQRSSERDKMGHQQLYWSHPRKFGQGSRSWSVFCLSRRYENLRRCGSLLISLLPPRPNNLSPNVHHRMEAAQKPIWRRRMYSVPSIALASSLASAHSLGRMFPRLFTAKWL